jgi:hypothetical protein
MVKKCKLQVVKMDKIIPAGNQSYVWISYLGDSLVRELFMGAVQRFSDYIPG